MLEVQIGVAQRAAQGQSVCGDAFTISRNSALVIGPADGLGHGPQAEEAARLFCDLVDANPSEDLEQLLRDATDALSRTRGAAAAILRIFESSGKMEFAGIGNIELQALSQGNIRPISKPGIVGRPIRKVLVFDYSLTPGDLMALHSDGVSSRFQLDAYQSMSPQNMAESILNEHGKNHDDSTCMIIKC